MVVLIVLIKNMFVIHYILFPFHVKETLGYTKLVCLVINVGLSLHSSLATDHVLLVISMPCFDLALFLAAALLPHASLSHVLTPRLLIFFCFLIVFYFGPPGLQMKTNVWTFKPLYAFASVHFLYKP